MTFPGSGREPLEKLAEEFAGRYRRGERPALTEYVEKHPELAEEIRDLFPALVEMEELRPAGNQATSPHDRASGVSPPVPELLGDYRILREVAHGGMGIVYEAVQESLGRHVALKVLPFASVTNPHYLERFRRESRAAAKLHHTNIVPVFGVGEHEGVHYYAMQFIQGQSLDCVLCELKRLRQAKRDQGAELASGAASARREHGSGPSNPTLSQSIAQGLLTGDFKSGELGQPKSDQSPLTAHHSPVTSHHSPSSELTTQSEVQYSRSVAQVGVQVAEALAYAHQQGILHRDIKPSNLLLDTQATVWVTDFGLVKEEGSGELTSPGDIVGTLRYMAPERFQGHADSRSDVYGLGLTLYEMLTLTPAFEDTDRARLMDRVQHEPPRPRKLDPRIPRDLETIVLKAIAKEPSGRYATATALAEDLRRFLADRPIQARRTSAWEHAWRWCRRNPVVATLSGMVLLALVAGVIGTTLGLFRAYAAEDEARGQAWGAEQARANEERERKNAEREKARANEKAEAADKNAMRAYRHAYRADMLLLQQAWDQTDLGHARELLAGSQPERTGGIDLRGFEWYYWNRLCHSERLTLPGHANSVVSLTFSPDGKHLASAGYDSTIRVWDAASGKERLVLGHLRGVSCVVFSPDGKCLASGGDKTVRVWDTASGKELLVLKGHLGWFSTVVFSPDSKRLAGSEDKTVRVWDVASGKELLALEGHAGWVGSVAFSPDGRRLASASHKVHAGPAGTVRVWDVDSGKELFVLRGEGHTGFFSVVFSPDGKRLASGSYAGYGGPAGTVRVWDVDSGKELFVLRGEGDTGFVSVAFSPDGKRLASSGDAAVRVWDAASGKELFVLRGAGVPAGVSGNVNVAFSPNGKRLASHSDSGMTVKVWDATDGKELFVLKGHTGRVFTMAFSPDGKRLASAGLDKIVRVWDLGGDKELLARKAIPGGYGVAFSPDGKRLASAGGSAVQVWDAASSERQLLLNRHTNTVFDLAFSPDGKRLASGGDNTVRIWDAGDGEELRVLEGHTASPVTVAFSPDGKRLASSGGRTLRVWDTGDGKELLAVLAMKGNQGDIRSVAFSPDGKRLASSDWDTTVHIWDSATGKELFTLRGHTGPVESVVFSPDGKRLSSGGDTTVRVWDACDGRELLTLKGHAVEVRNVVFSPDGKRLASGGMDKTVRVWEASTGQELLVLKGHAGTVMRVAFSPDGKRLASVGDDGLIIWNATQPSDDLDGVPEA